MRRLAAARQEAPLSRSFRGEARSPDVARKPARAVAVVVGPAFIGDGSIVRACATISGGTSIGPVCKVGGEVQASVLQSHSNKQHGGFLGHSFVGSWVNLGAATNNRRGVPPEALFAPSSASRLGA